MLQGGYRFYQRIPSFGFRFLSFVAEFTDNSQTFEIYSGIFPDSRSKRIGPQSQQIPQRQALRRIRKAVRPLQLMGKFARFLPQGAEILHFYKIVTNPPSSVHICPPELSAGT
jgi:hypothetical protein